MGHLLAHQIQNACKISIQHIALHYAKLFWAWPSSDHLVLVLIKYLELIQVQSKLNMSQSQSPLLRNYSSVALWPVGEVPTEISRLTKEHLGEACKDLEQT